MKLHRALAAALLAVSNFVMSSAFADAGVPPVLTKSWVPSRALPGGTVQIRFDMFNPGTNAALTGVTFTDVLPAGLSVGNIGATAIGCGTVSAVAPSTINYTNGTLNPNLSPTACNFSINITTSTEGVFTNTTSTISSNEGGSGTASTAILTVGLPPTIVKSFGAPTVTLNDSASLTFNISNPNSVVSATGVGFNDTLPAGLVVATPNGATNTCGGTLTAVAGTGSVALAGVSLAAGQNCAVTLNVKGTTAGVKNNSTQVTSTNLGNGNTTNTSITVVLPPPPTVTAINPGTGPVTGGGSVTITGTNFVIGATAVTIGGNACSSPTVASATSLTCTAPAGTAGTASVVATTAGGSNTANTLYTYVVRETTPAPVATGTGTVSAQIVSGSAGCSIDTANSGPYTPPAYNGTVPPLGGMKVRTSGCNPGETITLSVTFSSGLAGMTGMKYGKTPTSGGASIWYTPNGLSVSGNTITYTVTDNALGDDTFTGADGIINDPIIPVPVPVDPAGIPTLSEWGLLALSGLVAVFAARQMRRRRATP